MYGIPKDFDVSIFQGRTLETVSFAAYTVSLSFDGDLLVTIQSSYEHGMAADVTSGRQELPVEESTLMQLAGKDVTSAEACDKGTLVLHFAGDHVLRCFDDSPQYESYTIVNGGRETIV